MYSDCTSSKKKFRNGLIKNLVDDAKTSSDLQPKKGPKQDILLYCRDEILIMFDRLYSIREQLEMLEKSLKGFSVTEDTYRKFLRDCLATEYDIFLKNSCFLRAYNKIILAFKYSNINAKQFEFINIKKIGTGKRALIVTLDDYLLFVKKYMPRIENFLDHKARSKDINIHQNIDENSVEKVEEKQYDDEKFEISTSKLEVAANQNTKDLPKDGILYLRPDANAAQMEQVYPLETKKITFPAGVKIYFDTDGTTVTEDFNFLIDFETIQAAANNFKDNQLFICGTAHSKGTKSGFWCYRYYQGSFYFFQEFMPRQSLSSYTRQFDQNNRCTSSDEFNDFVFDEWIPARRE